MLKFDETLDELAKRLDRYGIRGQWCAQPNSVFMLRCALDLHGANLHWARGSKSIWFDGKPTTRAKLEELVIAMLQEVGQSDQQRRAAG